MFNAIALDTFDFIDKFSWHSCVIEVWLNGGLLVHDFPWNDVEPKWTSWYNIFRPSFSWAFSRFILSFLFQWFQCMLCIQVVTSSVL
jgi:hypothetical protein